MNWMRTASQKTWQWMCRIVSTTVSSMNDLLKTTFQVKLSFWLELCHLEELNNEPAEESFWTSVSQGTWKVNVQKLPLCHQWMGFFPKTISEWNYLPRGSVSRETSMMNMKSFQVSLRNSLFKTIFWVKLSYWLIERRSRRRPELWMCRVSCAFFQLCFKSNLYPHYTTNMDGTLQI